MVGVPPREDEQTRLSGARAEFAASLPRRLEGLRAALQSLDQERGDAERFHGLMRRVHALGSAARVLGFASASEALAEAERALARAEHSGSPGPALAEVARAMDVLPSLLLGAPPAGPTSRKPEGAANERVAPIAVLVFGDRALMSSLSGDVTLDVEIERTEDPARAREIARATGPDVILVDADLPGAKELLETLSSDAQIELSPVVVVGTFATAALATTYVTLGAERVLPKPLSAETLRRTVLELHAASADAGAARERVGELTVAGLADRLAHEIKKGLVEGASAGGRITRVDFGDGADVLAAAWGVVARVRELVTLHSAGQVRFQPLGPEGAIPVAPGTTEERRSGERGPRRVRGSDGVSLQGRLVLVADDDPAVVWFIGGLLKAVGARILEAHDGTSALAHTLESWPDLVVSDVLMPGLDGFALCHEIKRDVLIRDTPVVLLSWKEDLLQRVRELGANADGYLRKEASASTVIERVREVLRPRARVEQRLLSGGEVRGRLDGLTPRLVLDLVCRSVPDATITIRDAVYLYEVAIRRGRVRTVVMNAADGDVRRGMPALSALLGVNAGRFVVAPDSRPCTDSFDVPLATLLHEPVEKARIALRAVSAAELPRLQRVVIDLAAMSRYLACTPEPVRRLVERLARGTSPRDMLLGAEAAPSLLESVLSDLARRGAVISVERDPGASVPPPQAPAVAPLEPSAGAPGPAHEVHGSKPESGPLEPAPAETESNGTDDGWSFQLDPTGSAGVPPVAPTSIAPKSTALDEHDDVLAGLGWDADDAPPEKPATTAPPPAPAGPGADSIMAALAEAVVGARPPEAMRGDPAGAGSPFRAEMTPRGSGAWKAHAEPRADGAGSGASPSASTSGKATLSLGAMVAVSLGADTPPPLPQVEEQRLTPALPLRHPSSSRIKAIAPVMVTNAAATPLPEKSASLPAAAAATAPVPAASATPAPPREPWPSAAPASDAPVAATSDEPPPGAMEEAMEQASAAPRVETAPSLVRTLGLAVGAFAVAFTIVRWAIVPALEPDEPEAAPPDPSAIVAAALGSVASTAKAQALELYTETTELPPGLDVGSGNGLIEIGAGEADFLYVDGTPVGRGPRRPVTASAGSHEVKVVRNGKPTTLTVQVVPGRRTRVEAAPPPGRP